MKSLCLAAALFLVTAGLAFSQAVSGSLLGTVTDTSGGSVANAKVTLTESNTGVARTALSNESGNYSFPSLPPGTYEVVVEQPGFKKVTRNRVDVQVNQSVRVDMSLQPGNVSESVEVTAETPALKTERADTGRTIETKQLADLPVTGPSRNFQVLLNLVPGTTAAFRPHSEFFNPQNSLSTQVNGQSRLANNLQFEGVDNNQRTGLLNVFIPPIEALQTIDISTSNFEASLGRATGAVTNIVLKSGTNALHAQAYWFNRVSKLSSRPAYNPVRDNFVYNYVGGQIGGPIIKNRTFFFGDYLRIMDRRYGVDRYRLPTANQRAGIFTNNGVDSTSIIYDPRTGNPDGSGRTPFANNQIPADRFDPIAVKILALVPLPNLTSTNPNYFTLIPFSRDADQFDVKGDHNATDKDRISIRYSYLRPVTTDGSSFGLVGGPHGGGFQGTGIQGTHNGAINYDRIWSPTVVMQARVGVNRYRNDARSTDYGSNSAQALGVPGVNVSDFTSGMVGIDIGGFASPLVGYSASLPWVRAETNGIIANTWTLIKGNHTVRFGGEIRRIRDDLLQTQTFSPRGRYSYGTAQTSISGAATSFGNNLASFLLGQPNQVGRDLPIIFPAYRAWEDNLFVSDKWVVSQKLTLDLGLRWELYPPGTPAETGGFSNYNPGNNTLVIAGVGGNPDNLGMKKRWALFAPRIGVAYRMNEKTVIRSGFGISYAPFPDNTYAYNFPVKQNNAYNPVCSFCPALLPDGQVATLSRGFPAPTPAVIPANGIISNPDPAQNYDVINLDFKQPYVQTWNLAVQRSLPFNLALDVAYVGNHGVRQPAQYNLNASQTLGADAAGQPLNIKFGRRADSFLRFVGYSSSYNSLQVKLDKRFSSGLAITTSYTYSKALGVQSEDSGITFYINQERNWRRLDFDRRQNFVQSYVWELPFGKGRRWLTSGPLAMVVGGWQMNGALTIASGSPLNFGGNTAVLRAPGNGNTLNYFGDGIQTPKGNGRDAQWFTGVQCGATATTNCFAQPGPLQFGNLGPNVISGPGYWNIDGSVFREFGLTERFKIQLRGEAFSAVNTPRWNNPDTGIGNGTFGFITGAGGNRQVQLGTKLIW